MKCCWIKTNRWLFSSCIGPDECRTWRRTKFLRVSSSEGRYSDRNSLGWTGTIWLSLPFLSSLTSSGVITHSGYLWTTSWVGSSFCNFSKTTVASCQRLTFLKHLRPSTTNLNCWDILLRVVIFSNKTDSK